MFPAHMLFHALGAFLGYTVMAYAPTLGIFAVGSIVLVLCVACMVGLTMAKARGEI